MARTYHYNWPGMSREMTIFKFSNGKEKHHGNCPKYVHCICQFINDLEHKYNLKGNGIEVKYMIVLLNPSI